MFDPLTVAHEIKYPWRGKKSEWFPEGYRATFITVWHKDPCKDGSDDSCDWSGSKRPLSPKEKVLWDATWHLETILDNRPMYPDHPAHKRFQAVKEAMYALRVREGFRIHPRWHVWHWRIQIHPLQQFMRWAFVRCEVCRGRFKWNEEVLSWHSGIAHFPCANVHIGTRLPDLSESASESEKP